MTRRLLALGIAAGPLYIATGAIQMALREGFDPTRHALSILANGELGWIQVANFVVCGALVIAGAIGCRAALRGERAGSWGPLLLAVYGLGMIGAGVFVADPAPGFPPGVEAPSTMSRDGLLHFVFGGIAFYALIAACFVFARRFFGRGRQRMGWYSVVTGVAFFASFGAIASGAIAPAAMIGFYLAVGWIWVWHTVVLTTVALELRRRASGRPSPAQ